MFCNQDFKHLVPQGKDFFVELSNWHEQGSVLKRGKSGRTEADWQCNTAGREETVKLKAGDDSLN